MAKDSNIDVQNTRASRTHASTLKSAGYATPSRPEYFQWLVDEEVLVDYNGSGQTESVAGKHT
jgi:hypothetical protein